MDDESDDGRPSAEQRPFIDWRITMTLLFMVFCSSLALISWALASAYHATEALAQLAQLRVDTARQIEQLHAEASVGVAQGVHLDNVEKWINHADASQEQQDRRLAALEQQAALLNAQLSGITQASSARLGPRR
jgi:hypothetical protein